MARGWESKSVEDQILEKEAANSENRPENSAGEAINREKQRSLELARTRTMHDLESATDRRYRELLQRTLDYLDAELAKLKDRAA